MAFIILFYCKYDYGWTCWWIKYNKCLFGSKDIRNYVGSIDGKRISIREYDYQLRVALNNILNTQGKMLKSLKIDYIEMRGNL